MSIETTFLDFQLSKTFEEYEAYMNTPKQQAMFKEMGVKTFYIGKSLEGPQKSNRYVSRASKYLLRHFY